MAAVVTPGGALIETSADRESPDRKMSAHATVFKFASPGSTNLTASSHVAHAGETGPGLACSSVSAVAASVVPAEIWIPNPSNGTMQGDNQVATKLTASGVAAETSSVLPKAPAFETLEYPLKKALVKLPSADLKLIRHYMKDRSINKKLRNGDLSPKDELFAANLSTIIQKLPDARGLVARGASHTKEWIAAKKPGNTYVDYAFFSATRKGVKEMPNNYKTLNTHFSIVSKTGKYIGRFAKCETTKDEDEVLFFPGTKFRIVSVEPFPDNANNPDEF